MSAFHDNAVRKVNQARNFLMKNGQRNFQGYLETANRIITTADNYERSGMVGDSTFEPMAAVFRGFSEAHNDFAEGPGINGVANTYGIDVVDISILTSVKSFLPYLAVDRGMSKPTDLLTYQKLVAVNAKGQVAAGDDVVNPYKPLNFKARSSQADTTVEVAAAAFVAGTYTADSPLSIDFGAPLAPGSVTITLATGVTGEDVKGDGNVYFMGASAISATVDYINGTMAVVGTIAANDVSGAVARVDMGAEEDGANTLKLVPRRTNWTVTAVQHAVQLQNNIESISYIDKQILGKNFGEVATRQMLDAFIYTLNDEIVRKSIDQAKKNLSDAALVTTGAYLDLSTYYAGITSTTSAFQNFSTTKNEMIKNYLNRLGSIMLSASDRKFTYILCGAKAAEQFMLLDEYKPVMAQNEHLDSIIGYLQFAGRIIAVARHQEMNDVDAAVTTAAGSGTWASFILGYRDPEGAAAPVGYFEYLPICSSKVALNYQNSLQFSQSVFNYSTAGELIEQYIYRGAFKLA